MTFVDGFYTFSVELADTERQVYESLRVKTPKHPAESWEHLSARVLAYLHLYQPGQEFTRGLFELKEPTIWRRDVLGETQLWVQVGTTDPHKLMRAVKTHPGAEFRVYFFESEQSERFFHELRGAKPLWLDKVLFFSLPSDFLESLAPLIRSHNRWHAMLMDGGEVYLTVDDRQFEAAIETVDLWADLPAEQRPR